MPTITVIDRSGSSRTINGTDRQTLMEALREGGVEELVALCGGSCSCATCHVYVSPAGFPLPEMSEDEDDLLDSSDARGPDSRLSCQIPLTAAMDGMTVIVAPEE